MRPRWLCSVSYFFHLHYHFSKSCLNIYLTKLEVWPGVLQCYNMGEACFFQRGGGRQFDIPSRRDRLWLWNLYKCRVDFNSVNLI